MPMANVLAAVGTIPVVRRVAWTSESRCFVIGIDMTPEMVANARHNASLLGANHVDKPHLKERRMWSPSKSVPLVLQRWTTRSIAESSRLTISSATRPARVAG
jgi:hypothetical protein